MNQLAPDQAMRSLVVAGADYATRKSIAPVAVSHCKFELKHPRQISPCEKAFVQFERILRQRPDAEVKYEWANVFRQGLTVTFDVNWYDMRFFEDRKNAYLVGPHAFAFQRFGAVAEDFEIIHEISETSPVIATKGSSMGQGAT